MGAYIILTARSRTTARLSLEKQDEILTELRIMAAHGAGDPLQQISRGLGSEVADFITQKLEESGKEKHDLVKNLIRGSYNKAESSDNTVPPSIHISPERKKYLEIQFLSQIHYQGMKDREYGIPEAHEDTFKWVFNDSEDESADWSNLRQWLESDEQIYWITGKAGSGKSTLMRFLSQPTQATTASETSKNRCWQHLQKWTGGETPLIMASFYFWAAGASEIQTSQSGLFRSLLYQLLQACPQFIASVSPTRWESVSLFNEDMRNISEEELREMLYRAVGLITATSKVALFVDGLDEFDGKPEILIVLLRRLTSSYPIKVCLASRPWTEFEDEFKSKPNLKLENLTRSDIRNYVTAEFQENENFRQLQQRNLSTADHFIESIVKKACGVFLWVRLVVASLLAGLGHGDRIEDLEKRLAALPPELEELYGLMLDQIDGFYQEHASQYFQLMASCIEQPSLLLFSFADESSFTDYALHLQPDDLSERGISNRLDDMRRRLKSRCKGLLEVNHSEEEPDSFESYVSNHTVQYLHKTVMEYVRSPKVQLKLEGYLTKPYDATVRLLAANVALGKVAMWYERYGPERVDPTRLSYSPPHINIYMAYASKCHPHQSENVIRLLDGLRDFTQSSGFQLLFEPPEQTDFISLARLKRDKFDDYFLCVATSLHVVEYIKAKADWGCCITFPTGLSSRRGILQSWKRRVQGYLKSPNVSLLSILRIEYPLGASMIRVLLLKGADINSRQHLGSNVHYQTPWQMILAQAIFLFSSTSRLDEKQRLNVSDCMRLLVDHGADISRSSVGQACKLITRDIGDPWVNRIKEEVYEGLKRLSENKESHFWINHQNRVLGRLHHFFWQTRSH